MMMMVRNFLLRSTRFCVFAKEERNRRTTLIPLTFCIKTW